MHDHLFLLGHGATGGAITETAVVHTQTLDHEVFNPLNREVGFSRGRLLQNDRLYLGYGKTNLFFFLLFLGL